MILSETNQIAQVLAPAADRFNTNPASSCVSTKLYGHITFILACGAGATGTAKVQVEQCSAADGSGNEAIPFRYRVADSGDTYGTLTLASVAADGFTTTAGANKTYLIELDARELDEDKPFVRVQLTEVANDPVSAGIIAIGSMARYKEAVMLSMLS